MKKFLLTMATGGLLAVAPLNASAQTIPPECGESENRPENCADFYPPVVLPPPPATTTTTTTVVVQPPPGPLPRTGSGVSGPIQVGTLLLVGGALVLVAVRRRSDAADPAAA